MALLQRRPMTSAAAGGQNSSTEDVLGVAQKHRAEGPTAARDLSNQGSTNKDIVATEEGDSQRRGSRSTGDRRERQRAMGFGMKPSPPHHRSKDRGGAQLAPVLTSMRSVPIGVPGDVEHGQQDEPGRWFKGEYQREKGRGKGKGEAIGQASPIKPRLCLGRKC